MECKVQLEGTAGQKATGTVQIRTLSKSDRSTRAVKIAGSGLIITAVTAFIPIVHFVAIPLGLLLTVIFSLSATRKHTEILSGTALCPYCSKEIVIMKRFITGPFSERCEHCSRESIVSHSSA